MDEAEQLKKVRKNIRDLGWRMQDAPYHGVSAETIKGMRFAIDEILKGTGITEEEIIKNGG